MQTQHTTSTTVDTLEVLYWEARDNNNDALAEAIGLALDAAIEPKSWADVARCGHRNCRTRCHFDHAPAHGIPRPRLAKKTTTIEIVNMIENGHLAIAGEQITEHPEPARMAVAVLSTLCDHTGYLQVTGDQFRDAVGTVVRTLNAAR